MPGVEEIGRVGVAGCGAMGLPMAQALRGAGFDVCGFDVRPPAEFGGFRSSMILEAARFAARCAVVVCVVRDQKQVLDLCFGEQGLFRKKEYPGTLVLSSTVSPGFVAELAGELPGDVDLVDAPMSGAPPAAREARLTFMIGGEPQVKERLMPLFGAMGEKVFDLGVCGAGMRAKVLNNFVAACSTVAVRNVLEHAGELGIKTKVLLEVLHQSSGQTWFGSNLERLDWGLEPYERTNTIGILEKDVRAFISALEGADPLHRAVLEALRGLKDQNEGERKR